MLVEKLDSNVTEIIRLKLWYLHKRLRDNPSESFRSGLRSRIDIFRKTIFWTGNGLAVPTDFVNTGWLKVEKLLEDLNSETKDDTEVFEEEGCKLLGSFSKKDKPQTEAELINELKQVGYQCGCLKFDPPMAHQKIKVIEFHIANSKHPKSILDSENKIYLIEKFECLMNKSQSEYGAQILYTDTWLNSYNRWTHFFPQEYLRNMSTGQRDVNYSLAFWGQFVSANGLFSAKRGEIFRRTGNFSFETQYSWCTFNAMRKRLAFLKSEF